jgi:hypothetical protein
LNVDGACGTNYAASYQHILIIATDSNDWLPNQPFLTPSEMLDMDTKYDDGRPGTGKIMTGTTQAYPDCVTSDDPATAVYNTSYADTACGMIYITGF